MPLLRLRTLLPLPRLSVLELITANDMFKEAAIIQLTATCWHIDKKMSVTLLNDKLNADYIRVRKKILDPEALALVKEHAGKARNYLRGIALPFPITYQMETYFEQPLTNPKTGEIDDSILIRGYADLIDSPQKDVTRIIDIKTSAKSPNSNLADRCHELGIYAYLAACTYGFHCEFPVSLLYLIRNKTPKVIWLDSIRKGNDYMKVYDTIVTISTAIRQELFWKNVGLNCSWCEHNEICFAKSKAA